MILAEVVAIALLASLATGGSLSLLARESLKGEAVLLVLLPLQLVWPTLSSWLGLEGALSLVVWLLMMSVLAGVLMLNAMRRWPLAFAALGIAANVLVIGANQAMPVSIRAASEIGSTRIEAREAMARGDLHEEADEETRLIWLADLIAIPGPTWQRAVLSVGDILLASGLGGWIFIASRTTRSDDGA